MGKAIRTNKRKTPTAPSGGQGDNIAAPVDANLPAGAAIRSDLVNNLLRLHSVLPKRDGAVVNDPNAGPVERAVIATANAVAAVGSEVTGVGAGGGNVRGRFKRILLMMVW